MSTCANQTADKLRAAITPGNALLFLLFVAAIFQFPDSPQLGLDPSWRMVLGRVFHDHLQFGRDIVYNYGPLGFLMANTYFGLQYTSLLLWQLVATCVFAGVILLNARDLRGVARAGYILFFLFFGIIYPDALYMIVITLLGLDLVRHAGNGWRRNGSLFIAPFLALLAMMKFPNLVLGCFVIFATCVYEACTGRRREACQLLALFAGSFIVIWMLAGQNPFNIPAYISSSWSITQGYQEALGTPASPVVLWKGVCVFAIVALYLLLHVVLHPEKPRALAFDSILAAFLFLDWKHAFVRADAHTLVFFVSALVPAAAFPTLIEDSPRLRRLQRLLLLCAGALSIWAIYDITQGEETVDPFIRHGLSLLEDHVWTNVSNALHPIETRRGYDDRLNDEKRKYDLPLTRGVVGNGTIDVLGFEQAVALYNGLHYTPRPVFQSMSAYNPWLARINDAFFASSRAPEFVLQKIQTIDGRLPTLDDSLVLRDLMEWYQYVHVEKDFALWKRRASPPDPGIVINKYLPFPIATLALNTPFKLNDLGDHRDLVQMNLWARVDLAPSLFGHLRGFFYKPPIVSLILTDTTGAESTFTLPLSQARTGFILNPLIETTPDYFGFTQGRPGRRIRTLKLDVADRDKPFFAPSASFEISELPQF